jgi:endonuclease YncB( thermonuclease family)
MRFKRYILIFLFIITGIFYYFLASPEIENQEVLIANIIDGDTVKIENGQSVRLKGINTPEESMPLSLEAREFLENLVQNQTVELESYGFDRYGRIIAYIFLNGENINKKILENGFGHLYYYEKDNHYNEMLQAESKAFDEKRGIWKESQNKGCLTLIELKYKEEPKRCSNNEKLILENSCEELTVTIKDDATHIYEEKIPRGTFEKNFSCIWNDAGDSLYISDEEGLLIFYRY